TLTLQNLPGLATVVSQPRFSLGVDGDLPTFTNIVPGPDDWHSSKDVLVSATADDMATAGVSAVTLEYSYSTNGGLTFTDWSRTGLETTSDGPTVDGLVLLHIPDGEENFIRWRATDLVGNGPAVSANLRIRVDTINVTYTQAFPDPNEWQTVLSVECGVTIRDMDGAGIEVASIQYRVSNQNLSGYGEWLDWDEGVMTDTQEISVSQLVDMADNPFNYLQWRAKDIAGNGYTTSPHFRVKVDTQPIYFWDFAPTDGPFGHSEIMTYINVSDGDLGSGIAMATIEFRMLTGDGGWTEGSTVGMQGTLPFDRFSHEVEFLDGDDNRIQFRGWDVAGNGPGQSDVFVFVVDTTGPEFGEIAPGPERKQAGPDVTVTVSLWDLVVGLDPTSIEYQFATDGVLPEEWSPVPGLLADEGLHGVQVSITFAPGEDNAVQFRASDVLGNMARSAVATFWVNRAPVAAIKDPVSTEIYVEKDPVTLNASGSSDADGDDLNYTWFMGGSDVPLGYGKVLTTTLVPGVYNITLVVLDDMDAEDISSV
ncbi:MAG: PKD domain-containing protein, partial [Thermoplasmata archaeon]|nr:PKD domain-containing protein [Thermoplasmata archaeon]